MNAVFFVSGESIPQRIPISPPTTSTLTEAFPWLASAGSATTNAASLGDEFALFAEEASEWAELTTAAALETWPDE